MLALIVALSFAAAPPEIPPELHKIISLTDQIATKYGGGSAKTEAFIRLFLDEKRVEKLRKIENAIFCYMVEGADIALRALARNVKNPDGLGSIMNLQALLNNHRNNRCRGPGGVAAEAEWKEIASKIDAAFRRPPPDGLLNRIPALPDAPPVTTSTAVPPKIEISPALVVVVVVVLALTPAPDEVVALPILLRAVAR